MKRDEPPLRTAAQIAHELGFSQTTVYRMARKGLLPVTKGCSGGVTSRLEMDRKALEAFKNGRKR